MLPGMSRMGEVYKMLYRLWVYVASSLRDEVLKEDRCNSALFHSKKDYVRTDRQMVMGWTYWLQSLAQRMERLHPLGPVCTSTVTQNPKITDCYCGIYLYVRKPHKSFINRNAVLNLLVDITYAVRTSRYWFSRKSAGSFSNYRVRNSKGCQQQLNKPIEC